MVCRHTRPRAVRFHYAARSERIHFPLLTRNFSKQLSDLQAAEFRFLNSRFGSGRGPKICVFHFVRSFKYALLPHLVYKAVVAVETSPKPAQSDQQREKEKNDKIGNFIVKSLTPVRDRFYWNNDGS